MREYIDGNEAIVRGALAAGCTFFAGYPITPASSILVHLLRELPKIDGIGVQAEDEIAALGLCIGAAMAGRKAMTATSGPGMSLMSEHIGLAIMGEVPVVIVDSQRMGPATGGATTVSQSDVQFARWLTPGGYPMIVLCPSTVPECYSLTIQAFNLAERLRTPVILLADKEVSTTLSTIEMSAFVDTPLENRSLAQAGPFTPYQYAPSAIVPPFAPTGGPQIVRFTGSSHDERGHLTKNPATVGRLNQHLRAKIEARREELAFVKTDLQPGARTLLISFGITAGAMLEAAQQARARGHTVSTLTIHSLWPVPEEKIAAALAGVERVVVAELNQGQYRREIVRLAGSREVIGVNRVDGELISPQEILKYV
jgi:2-oxoglutarate/2-oxoacid ferredoxin oxidoreductase subunit alpha